MCHKVINYTGDHGHRYLPNPIFHKSLIKNKFYNWFTKIYNNLIFQMYLQLKTSHVITKKKNLIYPIKLHVKNKIPSLCDKHNTPESVKNT